MYEKLENINFLTSSAQFYAKYCWAYEFYINFAGVA